jgi:hypothetical protein
MTPDLMEEGAQRLQKSRGSFNGQRRIRAGAQRQLLAAGDARPGAPRTAASYYLDGV